MRVKKVSPDALRLRTRSAFIIFVVAFSVGIALFLLLKNAAHDDGTPRPLRRILNFNASLGERLLDPQRVDRATFTRPTGKPRTNGNIGLKSEIDVSKWRLQVEMPTGGAPVITQYTLEDLKALQPTEVVDELKCIEGWSEVMSFSGVRVRDFFIHYNLGTKSGQRPDLEKRPLDLYRFVGLETPDGEYYVSIDMRSLWNPKALLALEQNGAPLTSEHGAPLRLYVPNKYGVKSLKRIGKITFSDEPQADFWGERGYDWFIGL